MEKISVTRMTPAIGAEVSGIKFSESNIASISDVVYQLLLEHQVLFFRNQKMSPKTHLMLASSFGELEKPHKVYPHLPGYPSIVLLDYDENQLPDTNTWHTDITFRGSPPFASVLYSRLVPNVGGDTLWASMTAAYDALPTGMKSDIANLRAVHDMSDFRNNFVCGEPDGNATRLVEAHVRLGSAIHPIVQYHPATGRPHLFCNPGFTMHVEGMTSVESRRLLAYLFDHMVRPEFQTRFKWSGDVVAIWDNTCTMHYAVSDYAPARRTMHRATIKTNRRISGASGLRNKVYSTVNNLPSGQQS